jgi:hypothetical protein
VLGYLLGVGHGSGNGATVQHIGLGQELGDIFLPRQDETRW